jgi:hypothetical protein
VQRQVVVRKTRNLVGIWKMLAGRRDTRATRCVPSPSHILDPANLLIQDLYKSQHNSWHIPAQNRAFAARGYAKFSRLLGSARYIMAKII